MSALSFFKLTVKRIAGLRGRIRVGYIGGTDRHPNLGDRVMMSAVRRILPRGNLLPYGFEAAERRLARVGLSGRPYFDCILLGGGTQINEYAISAVTRALDQGLPVFALGTGAGSGGFDASARTDLTPWAELLPRFKRIGVRGPLSEAMIRDLGIGSVEVVGDLALSLCDPGPVAPADPPRFGLNVIRPHGSAAFDRGYLDPLTEAVKGLLAEGWQPVPFAMDPRDIGTIQDLLGLAGCPELPVPAPRTAEALFRLLRPCTTVVSVRLHAAVLATCVGVPPVLLGYLGKCDDFARSMGLERHLLPIAGFSAPDIRRSTSEILAGGDDLRRRVIDSARSFARRQREFLSETFESLGFEYNTPTRPSL